MRTFERALALMLAGGGGWLGYKLLLQHGHLLARVELLEEQLDRLTSGEAPTWPAARLAEPAAGPAIATDAIVYRPVRLNNGVEFTVALDPRQQDPISAAVAAGQPWFLDDYYVLLDLMKPDTTVLDLGGHVGTFALAAAARGCRVVCVEAAPENVRLLRASVVRNGFDRLRVVHGAVAAETGMVEFFPNGPWGTIANSAAAAAPHLIYTDRLTPVWVPALTVDSLVAGLGWDRVDLVKLDVEGSEVAALRGMAELLSRPDGPILLYESNAQALSLFGETTASLAALLEQFGYRGYRLERWRLVPTQLGELRPECVVNCLGVKGELPPLPGWQVTAPRSPEEIICGIVSAGRSAWGLDRAYLARILAQADDALLADPRVQLVLQTLRDDPDDLVRAAAAWFRAAHRLDGVGR